MNRGFKVYFKEAAKAALITLKRKGTYLKYYLYLCANIFGRLLIVPNLAYNLADARMAKTIARDKEITISKAFKSTDKPNASWTIFMVGLIKFGMYIGGILAIALCSLILGVLGFGVGVIAQSNSPIIYGILFAAPGIIPLLAYIIVCPFYLAPAYYVADTIEGAGPSTIMFKSIDAMKSTGKRTLSALFLSTMGLKIIYLGLTILIFILIYNAGKYPNYDSIIFFRGFAIIVLAILLAGMIIIFPFLTITHRVGNALLYEDIIIDKYNESKRVKGVYIQKFKTYKIEENEIPATITKMFDNQENLDLKVTKEEKKEEKPSKITKKASKEKKEEKEVVNIKAKDMEDLEFPEVLANEQIQETKVEEEINPVVNEKVQETPVEEVKEELNSKASEPVEEEVVENPNQEETTVSNEIVESEVNEETIPEETPVEEEKITDNTEESTDETNE